MIYFHLPAAVPKGGCGLERTSVNTRFVRKRLPGGKRVPIGSGLSPIADMMSTRREYPDKTSIYDVRKHADRLQGADRETCLISAMVEPDGIEPTTSCLQSRRSPS